MALFDREPAIEVGAQTRGWTLMQVTSEQATLVKEGRSIRLIPTLAADSAVSIVKINERAAVQRHGIGGDRSIPTYLQRRANAVQAAKTVELL